MKRAILSAILSLTLVGAVHAQQATEVYIPIGQSPGISDGDSFRGEIRRVSYSTRTMEVRGDDETLTVTMDDKTIYYLDRSKRLRTNEIGDMEDCKVGRDVEIKLAASGKVEWIKIETR